MKVAKWGNSLAVRLPAHIVEALGIKEGDDIALLPGEGGLAVTRIPDRLEVLREFREKYRGLRPKDYKFDRDELYDREPGDED
jgi:antitoxin MazE